VAVKEQDINLENLERRENPGNKIAYNILKVIGAKIDSIIFFN